MMSAMLQLPNLPYPIAMTGTLVVLVLGFLIQWIGGRIISRTTTDPSDAYSRRKMLFTLVVLVGTAVVVILWARLLQNTGTFLGIIGAGLAISLREPLLSIVGRIAIFAGSLYRVGDRIEIGEMTGDVIDVGFFYTRMMEIGNWISADQVTGRIVQFANATVFGNPVFNYTRNFSYIWDEVRLPITYESNIKAARAILLDVGGNYSREFLQGAQADLERMRHYFLVPSFELNPNVFVKVTDNWVELTMRYVVAPKQRRVASTFIFEQVLARIMERNDITIASSTMAVTVYRPPGTSRDSDKAA